MFILRQKINCVECCAALGGEKLAVDVWGEGSVEDPSDEQFNSEYALSKLKQYKDCRLACPPKAVLTACLAAEAHIKQYFRELVQGSKSVEEIVTLTSTSLVGCDDVATFDSQCVDICTISPYYNHAQVLLQ